MAIRIPGYSRLSTKKKQRVHMVLGGLAVVALAFFVSSLIGDPKKTPSAAARDLPKASPLSKVPGEELDSKDAWAGNAGREMTRMRDDLRQSREDARKQADEYKRTLDEMNAQIKLLKDRGSLPTTENAGGPAPGATAANAAQRPGGPAAMPSATPFPAQPRSPSSAGRLPAPNGGYPPGAPMAGGAAAPQGMAMASPAPAALPGSSLARVSLSSESAPGSGVQVTGSSKQGAKRTLDNYLPVGFVKAEIIGGLAAPTGGQAQTNPVPVLLRLADLAVLPNQFRAQVRNCFVIGEGYGDRSAERAYIRATLLSCVMNDKQVVEVSLKGNVFGEDGMNGVRGALVSKQDKILTNALLSGIAAGIGQGVAQGTQQVATSPLGTVTTNPTSPTGILKQGLGTGAGKALDRLSNYYIQLAESTFPVIEVQAGRTVDLVITQGVQLDLPLGSGAAQSWYGDRAGLMRAGLNDQED